MRKVLALLIAGLLLFPSFTKTVHADSNEYLRIINEDTPFYSDSLGNNLLFFLPFTYYVKILGSINDFYHVEIEGNSLVSIDGYVPKSLLFKDNLSVSNPYPVITVKTAKDCTFFKDKELSTPIRYLFNDRDMRYYGFAGVVQNERVYFVSYNNQLGYVKESDISPFSIPLHPNEQTFIQKPEETPSSPNENKGDIGENLHSPFSELSNAVIICLIIAGVLTLFIIFGKRKTTTASVYYDENDYE